MTVERQSICGFHRLEKVREVFLLALLTTSTRRLIALLVDAVVSVKLIDCLAHFALCDQGVQFGLQCPQIFHFFLLGSREIQALFDRSTTIAKTIETQMSPKSVHVVAEHERGDHSHS